MAASMPDHVLGVAAMTALDAGLMKEGREDIGVGNAGDPGMPFNISKIIGK